MIYAIGWQKEGPLKVGYAAEPMVRCAELQTGCPYLLQVFACAPGSRLDEGNYHLALTRRRLVGEWFDISLETLMRKCRKFEPSKYGLRHDERASRRRKQQAVERAWRIAKKKGDEGRLIHPDDIDWARSAGLM